MLATFKLHLAALHLPDQVRASGAAFFCLEMWVERMVQYFKRMIKYRTTAHPGLLFVHDHLLRRACERARISALAEGVALRGLDDAVSAAKVQRRKRCDFDDSAVQGTTAELLGAPRNVTDAERDFLLPAVSPDAGDEPSGLVRLLLEDATYENAHWPVESHLPGGHSRHLAVRRAIGLEAGGTPAGHSGALVRLTKFVRATLTSGDSVSCSQCVSQSRKDNSWGYVEYTLEDGTMQRCICRFEHFAHAEYQTMDGANVAEGFREAPRPLQLGGGHLFHSEPLASPGSRPLDMIEGGVPDLQHVPDLSTSAVALANGTYYGRWLIDLLGFTTQVVPTRELVEQGKRCRYFMTANKASGRVMALMRD